MKLFQPAYIKNKQETFTIQIQNHEKEFVLTASIPEHHKFIQSYTYFSY